MTTPNRDAPGPAPDAQIREWLEAGRSAETELMPDRAPVRKLAEAMASLANAAGGRIVLGAPGGAADLDDARSRTAEANALIEPPLALGSTSEVRMDGQRYLVIPVVASPEVHAVDGRYLTRTRAGARTMGPRQLKELLSQRSESLFEARIPPDATMADIDDGRVAAYLRRKAPGSEAAPHEALLQMGCASMVDGELRPTMAGVLLFGRNPGRHCPQAEILAVRYAGPTMSDQFVREGIGGTLPDQILRAEAFLSSNTRRGVYIRSLTREEAPEYPPDAVREALVNAIAHRDYSIPGDGIRIVMFSDRIEFHSPGRLPGPVTLQNIVEERYSRNPAVVRVLSDMGFIERLGYGIDRMIARMAEFGLPRPSFGETANGFRVTLTGHGDRFVATSAAAHRWSLLNLNERQQAAMSHLESTGRITSGDLQKLCPDVSAETLRRDFADLVSRGVVLRIGDKRATYYILK